ncbi:RNA-directed DNA polymerase, eukaryota, reverse transcriptase zinc-binding domain protein [Tanacetum coccineum]
MYSDTSLAFPGTSYLSDIFKYLSYHESCIETNVNAGQAGQELATRCIDTNCRWPPYSSKVGSHIDSALSYVYIQGSNWCVKSLDTIRQNFFHGVDGSDRKLVWIGWNMVQTSKQNGGLGVSSFFAHNRALLFKWVWRFLTDDSSLWTRFIKAIFGNKGALDTHKLMLRRSPWQDVILAIHSLQRKGEVALKVLYKRLYALETCKSISVAEKMGHTSLSHSFRRMPRSGVEQDHYDLLCSKADDLVLLNMSDRWCWSLEGSQEFSVKSTRTLIDNAILPKAEVPTRWLKVVPIKVNVHAWRVCLDKLPTRVNLSLRGIDIPSIFCPLCNSAVESTSHIFFVCPLARQIWRNFLIWWDLEDVAFNSYNE